MATINQEVFGRTNVSLPNGWAKLSVPDGGFGDASPMDLIDAVRSVGCPLDISSQPALWGSMVRGGQDVLLQRGTLQIELATSEDHATDLIQAHLIETLSALGREMIDFYYLRIRRNLEEYQINGALAALEHAKQEGYIRFLGLMADGPAMAVLGFWQFHDGFDSVMIPRPVHSSRSLENLEPLAHKRRVGVVLTDCLNIAGVPLSWLKPELELPLMALRQRKHKVITEIRNLHDVALLTAWRDGEVSTTDLEIESELSRLVERVQSPEFLAEIAEVRAPWATVLRANRLKSG
jgi:hypothetical protein